MSNNILKDIGELVEEMQSPNVVFSHMGQNAEDTDPRHYNDIEDLYEFIDKVREDKHLTFVQKNQLIEGRLNKGK